MNLSLASQIESVLFYKTEPTSVKWLSKTLQTEEAQIAEALVELEGNLVGRGIVLVRHDNSVMLATHPEMAPVIEKLHTKEIKSDLSKAALETLTIILYKGQIAKADLDYIRGVNSQFMLRNLLIRGLVEKKENPADKRRPLYIPSHETLAFLGISSIRELPEHESLVQELEHLLAEKDDEDNSDDHTTEDNAE